MSLFPEHLPSIEPGPHDQLMSNLRPKSSMSLSEMHAEWCSRVPRNEEERRIILRRLRTIEILLGERGDAVPERPARYRPPYEPN